MVEGYRIPDGHGVFVHESLPNLVCLVQGRWSCYQVQPRSWFTEFSCKQHIKCTKNESQNTTIAINKLKSSKYTSSPQGSPASGDLGVYSSIQTNPSNKSMQTTTNGIIKTPSNNGRRKTSQARWKGFHGRRNGGGFPRRLQTPKEEIDEDLAKSELLP